MNKWKRAWDPLENQLSFRHQVINTFPNPIFHSDTHGRYLCCKSAFAELIGKRFEKIAEKTNHKILDPHYADLFENSNGKLLKNPGIITYTECFLMQTVLFIRSLSRNQLILPRGCSYWD